MFRHNASNEPAGGAASRSWGWPLIGGIFSIIFGFVVLSYELVGLLALVYFACAYFLAAGVFELTASYRSTAFRWWYPIMGVLSICAGIVGFAWPGITLFVIAVLIGWVLLGWGLADILYAFTSRHLGHWWVYLVRGLFAFVVGVIALRDPGNAVLGLVLVLGIWSIAFGVVEIIGAMQSRHMLGRTPS
jgi:uncharacterized membrane protein HdeD (DUF308 family)